MTAIVKQKFIYSQSYVRDAVDVDACPMRLKFKYLDRLEERTDEDTRNAMFYGRYFEWHLLGATRDGIEPVFRPNKVASTKTTAYGATIRDFRPAAEVQLGETIEQARDHITNMGLDPNSGYKQAHLVSDDVEGHIDWITNDFLNQDRQAIYDVKWTATKYDDRYIGWADFDSKQGEKFQAAHYIILYWMVYGVFVPFYFLVFGKSGWVRVIKVELTQEGLTQWESTMNRARSLTAGFEAKNWPAKPSFNKCMQCGYFDRCPGAVRVPQPEVYKI
jgi:hypothetical protein